VTVTRFKLLNFHINSASALVFHFMTSRRWCFTSYAEDICPFAAQPDDTLVRYGIWQRERCPTTEREHWQGYLEFSTPVRLSRVRGVVGDPRCHLERARGDRSSARDYCRKDDTRLPGTAPTEYGTFDGGGQGRRSDIAGAIAILRAEPTTAGFSRLWDEHPVVMAKYQRGMMAAAAHYSAKRRRLQEKAVIVYHGDTGTGKTRTVYDDHSLDEIWRAPVTTIGSQWFDGYWGQKVALFDDFDGEHPSITHMLQLLDRYPVQAPVKGGFTQWCPEIIYITTNVPIDRWYPTAKQEHHEALKRRITTRVHFDKAFS